MIKNKIVIDCHLSPQATVISSLRENINHDRKYVLVGDNNMSIKLMFVGNQKWIKSKIILTYWCSTSPIRFYVLTPPQSSFRRRSITPTKIIIRFSRMVWETYYIFILYYYIIYTITQRLNNIFHALHHTQSYYSFFLFLLRALHYLYDCNIIPHHLM